MVVRTTLRHQVHRTLLRWLRDKRLRPGDRINEVHLARALEVSRTPIREALRSLEHGGLVVSAPFRGYFVQELSRDVVSQLYPLIGALEALAVRLLGEGLGDRVAELRTINRRLLAPRLSPARRYALDREWHETLTASTGNQQLDELLLSRREMARSYDGSYARGLAAVQASHEGHEAVLVAIEKGAHLEAQELIRTHWEWGVGVVHRWLEETQA
ncbi:MAG TPA: GntR family transcriptional regulator [Planctomycetota bacterium]|nr:GntR family transcriptional regulator [Planctomycetota bacterium]